MVEADLKTQFCIFQVMKLVLIHRDEDMAEEGNVLATYVGGLASRRRRSRDLVTLVCITMWEC